MIYAGTHYDVRERRYVYQVVDEDGRVVATRSKTPEGLAQAKLIADQCERRERWDG